jgi:hypothetical protein
MANLVYYHNTLSDQDTNELRLRGEKAKSDTFRVLELAKTFKTLHRWKAFHLYKEIYPKYRDTIQTDVIGRALSDLCAMGYLVDTNTTIKAEKGAGNKVYEIADVLPTNPIKIPKKICVELKFIEDEFGNLQLDLNSMSDEFIGKLNYYDNIFTPNK